MHIKDVRLDVLEGVKAERADSLTAWRRGLFCGLGEGDVDLERFCGALAARGYDGWVVVEQDRVLEDGGAFADASAEQAAQPRLAARTRRVVSMSFEIITMGRIGVDVYPLQTGVSLREVETFGKFLGGSPANVAVAAARYGRSVAVITRTGADPFGEYLHDALRGFGVDDRYVTPVPGLPTPVTFCEIFPPDDFPLYFYREPKAPDLEIHPEELDLDAIRAATVFWVTGTGLSQEPSRSATLAALEARGRHGITVFDLDYRPMFWGSREEARAQVRARASARHGGGRQPRRMGHRGRRPRPALGGVDRGPGPCRRQAGAGRRARAPWRRVGRWIRPSASRSSTASARATRSAARSATGCWRAGT